MATQWDACCRLRVYLRFTIWKAIFLSGVKGTHRVLFESPFQRHTAHWEENISRWKPTPSAGGPSRCYREKANGHWRWMGSAQAPHGARVSDCSHRSQVKLTSLLCLLSFEWAHSFTWSRRERLEKRGTFGRGRWKAPASTHPSVSMVWMTLPIQQQMLRSNYLSTSLLSNARRL